MRSKSMDSSLPKWPRLKIDEETQECRVKGKHVSYGRLLFAQFIETVLNWAFVIGLFYCLFIFEERWKVDAYFNSSVLVFPIVVIFSIGPLMLIPIPRIFCRLFFPKNLKIRFTKDAFFINGKRYENESNVNVQFRANRPHLSQEKYRKMEKSIVAKKHVRCAAYKLKFRKVEMIYGAKVVHLTSIADQKRADQFAIVLQVAYEISQRFLSKRNSIAPVEFEEEEFAESLPE